MKKNKQAQEWTKKQKRHTMIVFIIIIVVMWGCGSSNGDTDDYSTDDDYAQIVETEAEQNYTGDTEISSIWGEVQIIELEGEQTNARGTVTVEKDLMTDEELLAFHYEHINDSELNWFTIDFGDGTGYVFFGSRDRFWYGILEEQGRQSDYPSIGGGRVIHDTSVVEFELITSFIAPVNPTILELQEWADYNDIELVFMDSTGQVENPTGTVELMSMPHAYEGEPFIVWVSDQ